MTTAAVVDHIPTEHEEQRTFVQWFRRKFPDVRIFSIPNGGWRSPATAAKLKVEGLSKGVPDLFIPAWRMFVEMKRIKGGRLSPEQEDWKSYLEESGYSVLVCHGCEEAIKNLEEVRAWRI